MEATERELVVHQLAHSRERLVLAVEGLSTEQRSFRPAEDRWSIADCIEHITVARRQRAAAKFRRLCNRRRSRSDGIEVRGKDQIILEQVPVREQRVQGSGRF